MVGIGRNQTVTNAATYVRRAPRNANWTMPISSLRRGRHQDLVDGWSDIERQSTALAPSFASPGGCVSMLSAESRHRDARQDKVIKSTSACSSSLGGGFGAKFPNITYPLRQSDCIHV